MVAEFVYQIRLVEFRIPAQAQIAAFEIRAELNVELPSSRSSS